MKPIDDMDGESAAALLALAIICAIRLLALLIIWGMTREECAELLAHADGKWYVCAGDDCREEQTNGGVK